VPTLVESLKGQGYYTAAINKIPHMMPSSKFPWERDLNGSGKDPDAILADFEKCLGSAKAMAKPFFINANITDPHRPFPVAAAPATRAKDKDGVARRPKADRQGGQEEGSESRAGQRPSRSRLPAEEVDRSVLLEDIPLVRKEVAQYFTGVGAVRRQLRQDRGGPEGRRPCRRHSGRVPVGPRMSFPFSKASVYRTAPGRPFSSAGRAWRSPVWTGPTW